MDPRETRAKLQYLFAKHKVDMVTIMGSRVKTVITAI